MSLYDAEGARRLRYAEATGLTAVLESLSAVFRVSANVCYLRCKSEFGPYLVFAVDAATTYQTVSSLQLMPVKVE